MKVNLDTVNKVAYRAAKFGGPLLVGSAVLLIAIWTLVSLILSHTGTLSLTSKINWYQLGGYSLLGTIGGVLSGAGLGIQKMIEEILEKRALTNYGV